MFLNKNCFPVEDRTKVEFLNKNYEFCYLESMHFFNARQQTDTIITGLSYGINGLESSLIGGNTLNFSMSSQDLYYDYLHIKRAIENSKSISTCVITLGYYSLYYNLALTRNKFKCFTTYFPLFSDIHNAENVELPINSKVAFSDENLEFAHWFWKEDKAFYGRALLREWLNSYLLSRGGWSKLSLEERDMIAFQRTQLQNKHIKHIKTYKENIKIFNDMLELLNEHNIRIIVAILPFAEEYLKYINPIYKESIMEILEESPYSIDFIDMNEEGIFTEEDMCDSDHLNYRGAQKASLLIKAIIENII